MHAICTLMLTSYRPFMAVLKASEVIGHCGFPHLSESAIRNSQQIAGCPEQQIRVCAPDREHE